MLPRVNLIRAEHMDCLLFGGQDLISRTLNEVGVWEEHVLQIGRCFYAGLKNPLVLDIGANLGAFAIPVGKEIAEHGGVVHAYEPQRIVYYQLCGNIFLNRLDNVFAHYLAIGEKLGKIEIPEMNYSGWSNIGAFSLNSNYRRLQGGVKVLR